MADNYTSNLNEVLASYKDEFPQREHALILSNNLEYAVYLHDREGYYVFNADHAVDEVRKALVAVITAGKPLSDRNVKLALESAGFAELNFLRSLTGEMRPPVREGEGPREARAGGWADVTGNLANAYQQEVI